MQRLHLNRSGIKDVVFIDSENKFVFLCRVSVEHRQFFKQTTRDFKIALEFRVLFCTRLGKTGAITKMRASNEQYTVPLAFECHSID